MLQAREPAIKSPVLSLYRKSITQGVTFSGRLEGRGLKAQSLC